MENAGKVSYCILYYVLLQLMSGSVIDVHFVRLRAFERAAYALLSDDDEREIEKNIADDPERRSKR